MKSLILAAVAIPGLIGSVNCCHNQDFHQHLHQLMVKRLELTQAQQDTLKGIVTSHHPALKAKLDAAIEARADLFQAVANPKTVEAQIRTLEATASAADLALELEVNQVVKEIAPSLTADQHAKAAQLLIEARAHLEAFRAGHK